MLGQGLEEWKVTSGDRKDLAVRQKSPPGDIESDSGPLVGKLYQALARDYT